MHVAGLWQVKADQHAPLVSLFQHGSSGPFGKEEMGADFELLARAQHAPPEVGILTGVQKKTFHRPAGQALPVQACLEHADIVAKEPCSMREKLWQVAKERMFRLGTAASYHQQAGLVAV